MIPCPIEVLKKVLPTITDKKYKNLLEDQISSLNNTFQNRYRKDELSQRIKDRCCNLKLLEEKCLEYSD